MWGKKKISDLREEIEILQEKVDQLECPHEDRVFELGKYNYMEVCWKCQKVIRRFSNNEECKKAELEYRKKQVARLEAETKAD